MKKYIILTMLLALTACGIKPIYGEREINDKSPVFVAHIPERLGQIMMNALKAKFGYHDPNYNKIVKVNLKTYTAGLGLETDATYSVSEVTVVANFMVTERGTGKVLDEFSLSRSSTFSTSISSSFATETAQKKAETDAILGIAEIAYSRILAKLIQ